MIATLEIRCNAAHPEMPLTPFVAFKTSPSSVRILDVPKKIGNWNITEVFVKVQYPDNSYSTRRCVRSGNVWVGTLDGTDTTGTVTNGFTIGANGVDENGDEVNGYILGVGDVKILEADGSFHPEVKSFYVKILDEMPDDPKIGDSYFDGINEDILKTFNGYEWIDLGVDPVKYIQFGNNSTVDQYGVERSVLLKNGTDEVVLGSNYLAVKSNGVGSSIFPNQINLQNQITLSYNPNTDSLDAKMGGFRIQNNSSNGYDATLGKINLRTTSQVNEISIGSNNGTKTLYNQNGITISKDATPWLYTTYSYGSIILNDDSNYGSLTVGSANGGVSVGPKIRMTSSNADSKITIDNKKVLVEGDVDVRNNKITIKQGGVEKGSFTLNQSSDKTIELDAGGGGGDSKCMMNVSFIGGSSQYVSWTSGSDTFKVERNDSGRLDFLKNGVKQTSYYGLDTIIASVDGNVSIYDNGYSSESNIVLDNVRQSSYSQLNTTGKKTLNISMDECLEENTLITMADGSTKRVADLWIGDKVLSMNPDTLQLEEDEVSDCDGGILKSHNITDIWTFSDGTVIKTVKPHQFFNMRTGKMEYIADFLIGQDGVRKQDGTVITLVSHEQRRGLVYHNTLYTTKFNNYFANGILTGNRHSVKWGWYWTKNNA